MDDLSNFVPLDEKASRDPDLLPDFSGEADAAQETYSPTCPYQYPDGRVCGRPSLPVGFCKRHSTVAIKSKIKDPSHSKRLPIRLAPRWAELMQDAELLSTRTDIALLQCRIEEMLEDIDSPEAFLASWEHAYNLAAKLPLKPTKGQIDALKRVLADGCTQMRKWTEIMETMEVKRKCIETEVKRQVGIGQVITLQQFMAYVAAMQAIMLEELHDVPAIRSRLATRISALCNLEPRGKPYEVSTEPLLDMAPTL